MKAAFALLVDHRVHNFMRQLAVDMNGRFKAGLRAARFPAHITLKQTFEISDLAVVEAYFDRLAASIEPFEIQLNRLELVTHGSDDQEMAILWLGVQENATLRALHNRIIRELAERFEDTQSPFDGPGYRFHATLAVSEDVALFRRIYEAYEDLTVDLSFMARDVVMAYCANEAPDGFISYKLLLLGEGAGNSG